jgi:hypothetical protein
MAWPVTDFSAVSEGAKRGCFHRKVMHTKYNPIKFK